MHRDLGHKETPGAAGGTRGTSGGAREDETLKEIDDRHRGAHCSGRPRQPMELPLVKVHPPGDLRHVPPGGRRHREPRKQRSELRSRGTPPRLLKIGKYRRAPGLLRFPEAPPGGDARRGRQGTLWKKERKEGRSREKKG